MATQWIKVFQDRTVGELFPGYRPLVSFQSTDSVVDVLKGLEDSLILSAPVKKDNEVVGLVDVLDLLIFLVQSFRAGADIFSNLLHTPVSKVLDLCAEERPRKFSVVTEKTPISNVLDLFYSGIHRALVVGDSEEMPLTNMISQLDMVGVVAQCLEYFSSDLKFTSMEDLGFAKRNLVVANIDDTVVDVLEKMKAARPMVSAVPVINEEGKVVATFSASNLKGILHMPQHTLQMKVLCFLKSQSTDQLRTSMDFYKSLHPITTRETASYEQVAMTMAATKVHRLWVVDALSKPVGVVSAGDLFKIFMPWAARQNIKPVSAV